MTTTKTSSTIRRRNGYSATATLADNTVSATVSAPTGETLVTYNIPIDPVRPLARPEYDQADMQPGPLAPVGRYEYASADVMLTAIAHRAAHTLAVHRHEMAARGAARERLEQLRLTCPCVKRVWSRHAADGMGDLVCVLCGQELGPMGGDE